MTIETTNTATGARVQLGNFEKAVGVLALAFFAWMGTTVYSTSVRVSVIETQMDAIAANTVDRYTRADAEADKRALRVRIDDLERRALRVEARTGLDGSRPR